MAVLSLIDNTYFLTPLDTAADRLQVEVGDSKQPFTFYPQAKLMRWDNEVNLSVRLVDDAPLQAAVVTEKDGLISWEKGAIKTQFYEQPSSDDHPEGGYEFEVILASKPASNKLQFTIQTKGLDFFYQPALTAEEIKAGDFRPENVVGSYAVYHSEKRGEFIGGKNYRSGKAFHIYRPKATDAVGKEFWGELYIDVLTGILDITVDQKFLDAAVYPVVIDPTFGYTTGGGTYTTSASDDLLGSIFTSPAYGIAALSLSAYTRSSGSEGYVKGVICTHSDLNIISNGVGAATYISNTAQWRTSSFSTQPILAASTSYLLSVAIQNGNYLYYDAGDADQGHFDDSNSYATPTNPTDAAHNNNKYSIYATYFSQYDTSSRGTGSSNPQTLSYTCGADAKLLVLGIVTAGSTIRAGGAPTYNGVTMTQVDSDRSATETCCELWYLLNPATGSAHNISVPNTGAKTIYLLASSYNPTTAGYSYAYDTASGAVETSANPDVTVTTTVNNDVVVAVLGDGLDTKPTAQSYGLLFSTDDGAYSDNLQYAVQATAGNITMSWTCASDDWCMCVGAWKEISSFIPSFHEMSGGISQMAGGLL
jgi:hypothetical protein